MIDWKAHSEMIIEFGKKVASGQFEGQLNIKVTPNSVTCIFDDYTICFSNNDTTMLPTSKIGLNDLEHLKEKGYL